MDGAGITLPSHFIHPSGISDNMVLSPTFEIHEMIVPSGNFLDIKSLIAATVRLTKHTYYIITLNIVNTRVLYVIILTHVSVVGNGSGLIKN